TPVVKKTNNPVWDTPITFFVADTNTAGCVFRVSDSRDGVRLGDVSINVKDVINRPATEVAVDWFKLSGPSGKIRLSFKWHPVNLHNDNMDKAGIQRKEPIALIKVKMTEARGVANVETFRKSDPYAKIILSKKVIGATHVKENTLDPVWNETFYAVCYSMTEPLRLEFWDFNNLKKDRTLGRVEFYLNELLEVGKKEALDENGEIIKDEAVEVDLKREAWLAKNKIDGLTIKTVGPNTYSIIAPIYIHKSDEEDSDPNSKTVKGAATANSNPTLNISTTSIPPPGAQVGPRQKGFANFELEFFGVEKESYIRAETETALQAELDRRVAAETE
ncbi:hypothetical protein HDU76_011530, partial [Blyttiomyces sp. JEL0837]